jgi:glycosyltransferase involved in cell wall biosynthesis
MQPPMTPVRRVLKRVKVRWQEYVTGETDATFFDLHNLDKLNQVITPLGVDPLVMGLAQAEESERGAMRYILTEWATRPDLRRSYPLGLTERTELCEALTSDSRLSADAVENIRRVFAGHAGERVKRIYDMREDIRKVFLWALTPHPIRVDYLHWFIHHGFSGYGVTLEEVLWSMYEEADTPDGGLISTYLAQPDWQRDVPHALTTFGWQDFKDYLRQTYDLAGRWFDRANLTPQLRPWDELQLLRRVTDQPFPETLTVANLTAWLQKVRPQVRVPSSWLAGLQADLAARLPEKPGVNLLGHFRYPSGLQEAAVGMNAALQLCGSRTTQREMPVIFDCDWQERERFRDVELFDTTITLAAVNTFPKTWVTRSGVHWRPDVRRIAYWYWELEELPAEWHEDMQWPDEVWAPTSYLQKTYEKAVNCPVVTMLPGVTIPKFTVKPRSYFGIPEDRTVFLFSFDMNSIPMRKNPEAVIAAFRQAFRHDDKAHLVLKVSRGENKPRELAALRELADAGNIQILNETLTRSDTLALLNCADSYVSLHRAEGLGLGLAESMLLGKPVIATAYSGNMDFMNADVAHLVNYQKVPITADIPPYPKGAMWADADVPHAVELLRTIHRDPEAARDMGARAKAHVEQVLSPRAFGERMLARLRELNTVETSPT